jgi:hypothetical protein
MCLHQNERRASKLEEPNSNLHPENQPISLKVSKPSPTNSPLKTEGPANNWSWEKRA